MLGLHTLFFVQLLLHEEHLDSFLLLVLFLVHLLELLQVLRYNLPLLQAPNRVLTIFAAHGVVSDYSFSESAVKRGARLFLALRLLGSFLFAHFKLIILPGPYVER